MKKSNIEGSINYIESFGLVDGPGIRTVIFLNGCLLRCKYCHNPEMWKIKDKNYTPEELYKKILRFKPYYQGIGGVTFSGGEPLLQSDFIIETAKLLKQDNINICLDTSGVGLGNYEEILKYIDLVILDIKDISKERYKYLTGVELNEVENFIGTCNKLHKRMWIRQVIIPEFNDNEEYLDELATYLKHINNIERIDFLPYHTLGINKYKKLNLEYAFKDKEPMDKDKCDKLYKLFIEKYKKSK